MNDQTPQAIIDRDRELAALRGQQPHAPSAAKPAVVARDRDNRSLDVSLAKLRAIAIIDICKREGLTEAEAAAIVDAEPTLDDQAARAIERHEAHEKLVRRRMDALGLPISPPELYDDVVRCRVPSVPATRIVGEWLRNVRAQMQGETVRPCRALVLLGGIGLAKTASAGLGLSKFIRWGHSVAYVEERDLVHLAERRTLRHEDQLEALLEADLLVIDELGTSKANPDDVREAMRSTFNARIQRYTMMLGNLADDLPDDVSEADRQKHAEQRFATTYGARLVDRLAGMGVVKHVVGESMRGTPYRSPAR